MQLSKNKSITRALAAFSATLVGTSAVHAEGGNRSETSILIYSEKDRTRATEVNFSLTKQLKKDYLLDLRLTYDGLTGATPTGGSPSKYPQTITRSSGGTVVTVPAGAHPVDEYFKDTRFSADANVSRPLGREMTATAGARVSSEHDYKSLGINAGLTRNFNRNTTLGLSASYAHDVVNPVGGFYDPFTEVGQEIPEEGAERRARFEGKSKAVYDIVVSLAQVLDRKTLLRFNGSYGRSSGYLTDPYKIISVVQPTDSIEAGEPLQNLYEKRPGLRTRQAVYAEIRRFMLGSAVNVSYRYFWDDWSVVSQSLDVSLRVDFNSVGAITPRVRWYHQSEAEFYQPFLVLGQPQPVYASADSRLAEFDALTYGLGYSVPVNTNSHLNFSIEYYTQRGDSSPPKAFGSQLTFDLFPKLDVVMLRVGYAHSF